MQIQELIKLLAISFTALLGQLLVYGGAWYLYRRNVYIQKILYLNAQLKRVKEDHVAMFRIGRHVRFRPNVSFEENYPPYIESQYLNKNPDYLKIKNDFDRLQDRLRRGATVLLMTYLIGMLFLGAFYLIF